jgi:hypothetical protein
MMTTGEMLGYTKRFNEIMDSSLSNEMKDRRLSALMTDMEVTYNIPMFRNEEFEKRNPFVMQMYRTVSEARSF